MVRIEFSVFHPGGRTVSKIKTVELFGKQPRNKRPLKDMPEARLLQLHNYFITTPPESQVNGMNLDRDMIGPPITAEDLEHIIPSQRCIEDEMRKRGLLIDSNFKNRFEHRPSGTADFVYNELDEIFLSFHSR